MAKSVRQGRRLCVRVALAALMAAPCAAASGAAAASDGEAPVLGLPVQPTCISSPFGWRHALSAYTPAGFHNGVDLAAPVGAPVHAAEAGRVEVIRRHGPGGLWVLLQHADGRATLYGHLGEVMGKLAVGGQRVAAGETLGRVGRSGVTYGSHLFFAVFAHGQAIDPAPLLGIPRCAAGARRAG